MPDASDPDSPATATAPLVNYPIVAITDVHGQRTYLERLLTRLQYLRDWRGTTVVFLGDYINRGADVRGTIDLILDLMKRHPAGVHAVAGNHDIALLHAARLHGGPRNSYWSSRFRDRYDHESTFRTYLGRRAQVARWEKDIADLRDAMPRVHREFFVNLPWVVESSAHLFLHGGLSPELEQTAEDQLAALRVRAWDGVVTPRPGTLTAERWEPWYPVWLGGDKRLSADPLPYPGRVQVTGHKPVAIPDANAVRIRLDTSGGLREPLTACLLAAPDAPPVFIRSDRAVPKGLRRP